MGMVPDLKARRSQVKASSEGAFFGALQPDSHHNLGPSETSKSVKNPHKLWLVGTRIAYAGTR